jgi:hypothetical protein
MKRDGEMENGICERVGEGAIAKRECTGIEALKSVEFRDLDSIPGNRLFLFRFSPISILFHYPSSTPTESERHWLHFHVSLTLKISAMSCWSGRRRRASNMTLFRSFG